MRFVFMPRALSWDRFQFLLHVVGERFEGRRVVVFENNPDNFGRYDAAVTVLKYDGPRYTKSEMLGQLEGRIEWDDCEAVVIPLADADGRGYEELFSFAESLAGPSVFIGSPGAVLFPMATFREGLLSKQRALDRIDEHSERIRALRDSRRGERCFIIGNGPSLNRMDLGPLREETTFGVNAIYLNQEKMGFLPTYYTVEDVFVCEDRAAEINALAGPLKFLPLDMAYCLRADNGGLCFRFERGHEFFPSFSLDCHEVIYWGGTVLYVPLQLAFYMGFQEVYLIGVDFDYKIPDKLFGPNILSSGEDPNHFHPSYFGKGYRWHHPRLDRMLQAFLLAHDVYREHGRRLVNATLGGKLDQLPRESYEDVLCRGRL